MLYSWADNKKKANLMLSLFIPGSVCVFAIYLYVISCNCQSLELRCPTFAATNQSDINVIVYNYSPQAVTVYRGWATYRIC